MNSGKKGKNGTFEQDVDKTKSDVGSTLISVPEKVQMKPHNSPNKDFDGDSDADDFYDDDDEDDDWDINEQLSLSNSTNCLGKAVQGIQRFVFVCKSKLSRWTNGRFFLAIFLLAYTVYFIYAMVYRFGDEPSVRLLVCTILGVLIGTRHLIARACKAFFVKAYGDDHLGPRHAEWLRRIRFYLRWLFYIVILAIMLYVLIDVGRTKPQNLRSLPGLFIFLLICLLFSTNPGMINWHTVYWGLGLQFICALITLRLNFGRDALFWVQERLEEYIGSTKPANTLIFGASYLDHQFIFESFPLYFFLNATLTMLYYLGVMQFLVHAIGAFLSFVMDIQSIEATSVAAGMFMEGPLAILSLAPYLSKQSKSQLFVIMTSTLASLGGAFLAILNTLGVQVSHILPAMLVSAPATFAVSKLMIPETRPKDSKLNDIKAAKDASPHSSVMEALQAGATSILPLLGNILAIGFSFYSFIIWGNGAVGWMGDRVGIDNLSMEKIFSYVLYPVALAMGIEPDDCEKAASLLGYRLISSNLIAFFQMMPLRANRKLFEDYMISTNYTGTYSHIGNDVFLDLTNVTLTSGFISERTEVVMTFALCGFSSFLSSVVMLGTFYTLMPRRRAWLSTMIFPAMVAGNITNFMTGCFASMFY